MLKMINEDFFDSVESDEYEDEIEDIDNGYDDSESKKVWNYVLRIEYNMNVPNSLNRHNGTYVYNVRKMADKMRKCIDLLGLFKKYYIDKVELTDPNNDRYKMNVDIVFDRPEPEEFDLYKHYGEKRWSSFMPTFIFYVYFNECVNLTFKGFCDRIYTLRNIIRTKVCEYPNDSISYEFMNNYSGKSISYTVTAWFSEGTLERIYNELYKKKDGEKLRTSTSNDSYMEIVCRKNPLDKIVITTVRLAKQKYDIELIPHFIHNPSKTGTRASMKHPFVTFDLKKDGSVDVEEIEKCMLDCFFNRLSMDYFYFMYPVAVVKPLCKVTNNKPTPVKNRDYHHFFKDTLRECFVTDYHSGRKTALWRLRMCLYNGYGIGNYFYIAIVNKNGLIMRDHSKFINDIYTSGDMGDFVINNMTDEKIWN